MGVAKRRGYWDAVGYPLSTWIVYILLFSVAAAVGLYHFAAYFLTGTGLAVIAVLSGLWAGARMSKLLGGSVGMGMLSGFMLGFVAGLVGLLLMLGLGALLPGFAVAASGSTRILALLSAGIESWLAAVLLATLSSAVGSEFARK